MITLREMLEIDSFVGSVVVAGGKGLDREVEGIAIMEVPDIDDYVSKGDFLLSTLYPIHSNEYELSSFINRLNDIGLSGIGIKLNRYLSILPDIIISSANKLDFPVIILPQKSNFSIQINGFLKKKLLLRNYELQYRNDIHHKLMEMMLFDKEFDGLASGFFSILKKDIILFDDEKNIVDKHIITRDEKSIEKFKYKFLSKNFSPTPKYSYLEGFTVFTICNGRNIVGYVAAAADNDKDLPMLEKIAIEQFAIVFNIIEQKKAAVARVELRFFDEFANDLLLRPIDDYTSILKRSKSLGFNINVPLFLVVLQIHAIPKAFTDQNHFFEKLKNKYLATKPKKTVFANVENNIIVFFEYLPDKVQQKDVDDFVNVLHSLGANNFHIGVSKDICCITQFKSRYEEAKKALEIVKWTKKQKVMYSEEIGIYRIIASAKDKDELILFADEMLSKVVEYDKKSNAELMLTLRTYIECGGNLKLTAKTLYIHYNTVRYRYRLLEQLTGKDLSLFNDLLDLNLALKIYFCFTQNIKLT